MTITMYGADWCGDCVRAKKFFADNHVDYLWIDLEKDENSNSARQKFCDATTARNLSP
jgi:mycoredoxin